MGEEGERGDLEQVQVEGERQAEERSCESFEGSVPKHQRPEAKQNPLSHGQ
jgi:hypothetical protein